MSGKAHNLMVMSSDQVQVTAVRAVGQNQQVEAMEVKVRKNLFLEEYLGAVPKKLQQGSHHINSND